MDFDLILRNVSKHITLNSRESDYFISLLEPKKAVRNEFLLHEGEVCRHSAFVTHGCLYGYTVDHKGGEHVISFAPADWWIADLYSVISGKPARMNIRAQQDSEVLLLSRTKQEELHIRVPKFERFFRIIIENSVVARQQLIIDNLSLTAEERFRDFCRRYPTLTASVPQKHIASYIGITPEFFSKMRSRMSRKR